MDRQTKQCPHCGKEILAVARKCKHCGKWLENPNQPVARGSENITPTSASAYSATTNTNDNTKIVLIIGVLIFAIVIITVFIVISNQKSDYESNYEEFESEPFVIEETYDPGVPIDVERPRYDDVPVYQSDGTNSSDEYYNDNSYRTDSYDPYSDANAWN